jgi:hypothetical protein
LWSLSAEGFGGSQQVDGFEPVCFTLTVLAEDDVEAFSTENFAAQIPKIVSFN